MGRGSVGTTMRVVGLGQCSWDLLGRVAEYPQIDQKVDLLEFSEQGGGPVATALVTLARLGCQPLLFGSIGGDQAGDKIATGLKVAGVDISHLQVDPSGTSQLAFVAVESSRGLRTIFCNRGARRPFFFTRASRAALQSASALLLDGTEPEAALEAAQLARSRKIPVVLDGGSLREKTLGLLPWCDHLVVSRNFAEQLSPGAPGAVLDRLLQFGCQAAVITLGAEGCVGRELRGPMLSCPAFGVEVVDTTGCGDVFHGGYLYGLLSGLPLPERLRFASACAALKARRPGGQAGIPQRGEVERLLRENP